MRKDIFFAASLLLVALLIYGNTLRNGFVLDDEALIVNNPLVKSPSLWPLIFRTGLYDYPEMSLGKIPFNKMYRPLQTLSYGFEYSLWGLNPKAYHLTNILLHALAAMLIFHFFVLLFNRTLASIASFLFLVHPLQVSVVSYISGRADLLVSICMLASMIFFLRFLSGKSVLNYGASLFFATASLLCRESALLLPLFIILLLRFPRKIKSSGYWIIPFLLLDMGYLGLRFMLFKSWAFSLHPSATFLNLPLRLVNFFEIILRYLLLLVIPKDLHVFRSIPFVTRLFGWNTVFVVAALTVTLCLLFRYRQHKPFVFGVLWFFIGIIPVYFYLDAYRGISAWAMMAESWVYLSSVGFFILIASLIRGRRLGKVCFVFASLAYSFGTISYNATWHDSLSLYKEALKYLPEKNTLRKNIILEYLKQGQCEPALTQVQRFSRDYPESSLRYFLDGRYDYACGRLSSSIKNFETAFTLNRNNYEIYYYLGLCYEEAGRQENAKEAFSYSLTLNPHFFDSLIALGDLYAKEEDCAQALVNYQEALAIDPHEESLKRKMEHCGFKK